MARWSYGTAWQTRLSMAEETWEWKGAFRRT